MIRIIFACGLMCLTSCSDYDIKNINQGGMGGDDTALSLDTSSPKDSFTPTDTADPEPELPVAVCEVSPNPVSPPFESATWVGSDSYDPSGGVIVDYSWSLLSMPAGSTVSMPAGAANRSPFIPDMAGDYTGQLIVTNDIGINSEPCEVILNSTPAENLWIEMYWEFANDDMDLHLIAPGGTYNNLITDCYYANCTPAVEWIYDMDWGTAGYEGDDPSLDLDDINGTGPENINILDPQTNGVYTVVVHDYRGSTPDVYDANDVTVNIYLNGTLTWTDTRAISGDDTVTEFAEIDWNTGTVSSL